jgi:hypothetical protein
MKRCIIIIIIIISPSGGGGAELLLLHMRSVTGDAIAKERNAADMVHGEHDRFRVYHNMLDVAVVDEEHHAADDMWSLLRFFCTSSSRRSISRSSISRNSTSRRSISIIFCAF